MRSSTNSDISTNMRYYVNRLIMALIGFVAALQAVAQSVQSFSDISPLSWLFAIGAGLSGFAQIDQRRKKRKLGDQQKL